MKLAVCYSGYPDLQDVIDMFMYRLSQEALSHFHLLLALVVTKRAYTCLSFRMKTIGLYCI